MQNVDALKKKTNKNYKTQDIVTWIADQKREIKNVQHNKKGKWQIVQQMKVGEQKQSLHVLLLETHSQNDFNNAINRHRKKTRKVSLAMVFSRHVIQSSDSEDFPF